MENEKKPESPQPTQTPTASRLPPFLPPRLITMIADEVVKIVALRLPTTQTNRRKKPVNVGKFKSIDKALFLDTSAIIDGRIFDVINLGLLSGIVVVSESILLELKHIADSQDMVKRERGRRGLDDLEKIKKNKDVKVIVLDETLEKLPPKIVEVDEKLIRITKQHKGKIITCDYNLGKKALIEGVKVINMHTLANALKVTAVPGEALHIKVLHHGKEMSQGVGYLDDGTMLVIEEGEEDIGKMIDVVVSRVIQTSAGRILFAKKI